MKKPIISIAPMMDCTDRHYRYFMRLMTKRTVLYSEMVTANAVVHGDQDYLLGFDESEHPLVLQLGGSDPDMLAKACVIAKRYNYDEINLNVGCPSDRVQKGRFGACLMKEPKLVKTCVEAMQAAVDLPITVKTRLGVDELDDYAFAKDFIATVKACGCDHFIVHARKAWLKGLSPRENREVPPLMYDRVYQLKSEFPDLIIGINGGIKTLDEAEIHLQYVDEVMIGREVYAHPYLFSQVDQRFFNELAEPIGLVALVRAYMPYVQSQLAKGVRLRALIRPLIGLFQGCPGARAWRRYLSVNGGDENRGVGVIEDALNCLTA